jgi:hypothetical protein
MSNWLQVTTKMRVTHAISVQKCKNQCKDRWSKHVAVVCSRSGGVVWGVCCVLLVPPTRSNCLFTHPATNSSEVTLSHLEGHRVLGKSVCMWPCSCMDLTLIARTMTQHQAQITKRMLATLCRCNNCYACLAL